MVKKLLPSLSMFVLYVVLILGSPFLMEVIGTENQQIENSNVSKNDTGEVEVNEKVAYDNLTKKYAKLNLAVLDSNVRVFCFSSFPKSNVEIVKLYPAAPGKYEIRFDDAKAINDAEKIALAWMEVKSLEDVQTSNFD
ncbi:hypothetical protein RBH29_07410 [Herbivorax sp. ANBcel31]|uniref:hypothetical protein n=1 Tax=Herbivorax sp. ANBcel31 TaxID=3069754 RepID=UPI0027B3FD97|nr:hypothetical protein [Herbivorax sp. ANBcel31]MDQ2086254.1 hypothetical protein [Herbivorax sp. ANBcel31]